MVNLDERHTNGTNGARVRGRVRSLRARMTPSLAGAAILLATLGATNAAHAQMDVAPPLPNVLILLDSSGSMERKPDGTLPAITTTTASTDTTQKSRWISALEVLGGGFKNYSAIQVPRDTTDFVNEYQLLNGATPVQPYDYGYYLPHFRPMANGCTPGPSVSKSWSYTYGVAPTFGATDFGWRSYVGGTTPLSALSSSVCASATDPAQVQDTLGILTTFQSQARFGLMTFDSQPASNTGYPSNIQNAADGVNGQWSYFPGWNGGTSAVAHGWPNLCDVHTPPATPPEYEVGARNPGAPPWEGPLIPLANSDSASVLSQVNNQIRYAMFAQRPYGATPISPMMQDAYYYFRGDPNGPSALDPQNACRGSFIILITDGFPNQDLRPGCESNANPALANTVPLTPPVAGGPPGCSSTGTAGCCPSMRAQDIAYQLANPPTGTQPIKTFVVGFAVSNDAGTPIAGCDTMNPVTDCPPAPISCTSNANCTSVGGVCNLTPGTDGYGTCKDNRTACCTLHQIAYQGGTNRAFIATSADTLRSALVSAMSSATASTSTSRTVPVFARVSSASTANATQFQFQSSFKVSPFGAWQGTLERLRWQCVTSGSVTSAAQQTFSSALGDDFAQNLNSAPTARNFCSWNGVVAGTGSVTAHGSSDTVRPNIDPTDLDGVDMVHGVSIAGTGPGFVTNGNMTSTVMAIDPLCMPNPTDVTPNPDGCKTKYLNYALGQHQPTTTWATREGNALGDIYHATPVNVGPPSSYIRDESYTSFRQAQNARPPMLLVSTNDGMIHGFREDVTTLGQNELWAFVPPAVMPQIPAIYGGGHALLMDASPVLRDVAFAPAGTTVKPYGRARVDVRASKANWRSVVVGGLSSGGGYYALDVTDPTSPTFLWQITTANKLPLFGSAPGTPAIGVVYYRNTASEEPIETPVAFLPGGSDVPWTNTRSCQRWNTTTLPANTRTSTRCFSGAAQSLTVVRLYDGKILRTFRNDPNGDGQSKTSSSTNHPIETNSPTSLLNAAGVVGTYAKIDSPISGTIATYPAATGTVTTRAFVGDLDGTMWKADVSAVDPSAWTFSIFHDAYGLETTNAAMMGQPIATAPVITVNRVGDITTLYATGDQNTFASTNVNHVWSVTEKVVTTSSGTTFPTTTNWHMRFDNGLTPTGPLTLFNEMVYFSTFSPDAAAAGACLNGSGMLWSVHYLDAESSSSTLPKAGFVLGTGETVGPGTTGSGYMIPTNCRIGGTASAPTQVSNQPSTGGNFRCIQLDQGSIVFGAGVTSRPTCVDSTGSISTDPYTGATSTHQQVSAVNPGSFELVVQTGPKAGTGAGGSSTKTLPRTLIAPVTQTRIDSWAAIVE
jgi:type IV pilus assembly protein PilY1